MSSGETFVASHSADRAARSRKASASARSTDGGDRRELVEQDGVVDRARPAGTDEHEVARDVRPQSEQDLDAAAAFGGRRSGGRGGRVVGVGSWPLRRRRSVPSAGAGAGAAAAAAAPLRRPVGATGGRRGSGRQRRGERHRARDRRPRRRETGGRPGIGHVQQEPGELGPDQDRVGRPRIGERESPAGPRPAGRAGPRSAGPRGRGRPGWPRCRARRRDRAGPGSSANGPSAGAGPRRRRTG